MEDIYPENYNSKTLVNLWDKFIDWEKRRKGEQGFLKKQLSKFNCKRVFDSCLGSGIDSIYLIKKGFEVISNDIDNLFIGKAKENTEREGVKLKITKHDWRELDSKFGENEFDAIICLGNSLTYLFDKKDRIKTLENFYKMLKETGILIIDERNYDYILKNKKEILNGNFRYSGKYIYCGEEVHGKPVEISDEKVRFKYLDEKNGGRGYLILYPFKKGELKEELKIGGFGNIKQFSDYKEGFDEGADFYQYICVK